MTKQTKSGGVVWLGAVALGLALVGCGSNEVQGSAVTGDALSEGPVMGTVALSDSSAQPQQRLVSTRADGSFSVLMREPLPLRPLAQPRARHRRQVLDHGRAERLQEEVFVRMFIRPRLLRAFLDLRARADGRNHDDVRASSLEHPPDVGAVQCDAVHLKCPAAGGERVRAPRVHPGQHHHEP